MPPKKGKGPVKEEDYESDAESADEDGEEEEGDEEAESEEEEEGDEEAESDDEEETGEEATCGICAEPYKARKVKTQCPSCQQDFCKTCVEKWILASIDDTCPYCKRPFMFTHLKTLVSTKFIKESYFPHKTQLTMAQERSLLPETQEFIVRRDRYKALSETINQKKRELYRLQADRRRLDAEIRGIRNASAEAIEAKPAVVKCPNGECRGFLAKSHCELCGKWSCKKCMTCVGDKADKKDHTCDPSALATAREIRKSAKPCPSCATPTIKSEGCNQMWCTSCHTPWDWATGAELPRTAIIHNPYYFEHMRRNGGLPRQPGDDGGAADGAGACREIPLQHMLVTGDIPYPGHLDVLLQLATEASAVTALREDIERRDLRIRYLDGEIDDKRWASLLSTRTKRMELKRELDAIRRGFVQAATTIFGRILGRRSGEAPTPKAVLDVIEELLALIVYINGAIADVLKVFSSASKHGITYDGHRFFLQGYMKYKPSSTQSSRMFTDPTTFLDVAAERKRGTADPIAVFKKPKKQDAKVKEKRPVLKKSVAAKKPPVDEFSDDSIDD